MLTKALALALTAVALVAPPSRAEHALFGCRFNVTDENVNLGGGDRYTSVAYGYVVSPTPWEAVSIRCYVSVDGFERAGTNLGAGTGVAHTAGPVEYTADDTQDIDLCAEWTAGSQDGTTCFDARTTQIPPQEVIDLAHEFACLALNVAYAGVPGVVEIRPGGDVYVLNSPVYSCS